MRLNYTWFNYICIFPFVFLWTLVPVYALPTLESYLETPDAVIHEPYSVIYEVSWSGNPAEYASIPPTLTLDGWGRVSGISTSTHVVDGKNIIRHKIAILPMEAGEFTIPETDVSYFSPADLPEEDEKGETPDYTYPALHAGVLPLTVHEPPDFVMNIVMFTGFGIVLLTCAFVFYRRNAVRIAQSSDYLEMTVPSMIHDAKKQRLDQNYYAFFQRLLRGAGLLKDSNMRTRLQKHYEELAMSAGYKGFVPTDADLETAVSELETAYRNDD